MKGSLRQRSPGSWEITVDLGRDLDRRGVAGANPSFGTIGRDSYLSRWVFGPNADILPTSRTEREDEAHMKRDRDKPKRPKTLDDVFRVVDGLTGPLWVIALLLVVACLSLFSICYAVQ